MDDTFDMTDVVEWVTGVTTKDDTVCDFITAWINDDLQRVDIFFIRSKSLIYLDAISDSVLFYSKSVGYLATLQEFNLSIPQRRKKLRPVSMRMLHSNY